MINPVHIIFGPTASGKSARAVTLAQERNGVVINADATQLYADLKVLSARPELDRDSGFRIQDSEKQAGGNVTEQGEARSGGGSRGLRPPPKTIPHRLYGILPGNQPTSAALWLELVKPEIEAAWRQGKLPILCGGTGLYLKALQEGLSPMPEVPAEIRAQVQLLANTEIHTRLQEIDPVTAAKLKPGDTQRLRRAYEVFLASGKPLSFWQMQPKQPIFPDAALQWEILNLPRAELYARCDARFIQMLEQGAVAEVIALQAKHYPDTAPVMKAVGVPELSAYLRGEISLEVATSKAQQATRNYAKRQVTWLKNQFTVLPLM